MRKFVMLGAGLMLMGATGVALAQTAAPPPPAPQAQADTPPPPPPGGPGMRGPGGPGMRGPMGGPMHAGPPPSRAASFHIEKGDTELHVRCAENEPMQACVNAASALLDKVSASQPR